MVPSRSIAHRTLILLRASAIGARVCLLTAWSRAWRVLDPPSLKRSRDSGPRPPYHLLLAAHAQP
jgi:hypothetical protein